MAIEINAKSLFSDTQIPDVFIKDYLPELDGDSVRVYIYYIFLAKSGTSSPDKLWEFLGITEKQFEECMTKLETFGLITQRNKKVAICDLKEKELNKFYRPRTALDPEKSSVKKPSSLRANTIKHISDTFFAGQMGNSWYSAIDLWYEKYGFDDAVMVMLFTHCASHLSKSGQSLSRGREYVRKVAENWAKEGIRTPEQLDKYLMEYDKYKAFRNTIVKKAAIKNLDDYQEEVISKWFFDYKYSFDIVELALKKSVSLKNISVQTYDLFITEWFKAGLRTREAIAAYEENKRKNYLEKKSARENSVNKPDSSVWNYDGQRDLDDSYFENLEKRTKNK